MLFFALSLIAGIHSNSDFYQSIDVIRKSEFYKVIDIEAFDGLTQSMIQWRSELYKDYDAYNGLLFDIEQIQLKETDPYYGRFLYHLNLGDYYFLSLGQNHKAHKNYLNALNLASKQNDDILVCEALKSLLRLNRYGYLEDNTTSAFYIEQYKKTAYDQWESEIATYYELMMNFQFGNKSKWDQSTAEFLVSNTSNKYLLGLTLQLMATHELQLGNIEEAINLQTKAINTFDRIEFLFKRTATKVSQIALLRSYIISGRLESATSLAKEITGDAVNTIEDNFIMYEFFYKSLIDSANQDYASALNNMIEYAGYLEDKIETNNLNSYRELETKYQSQQRENEILRQEAEIDKQQQQMILLGSGIGFVALIGLGSFFYNEQRKKNIREMARKNQELSEQKIEDLITQQEVKTTYALLEGQDKERQRIGKELHDNISSTLVTLNMFLESMAQQDLSEEQQAMFDRIQTIAAQAGEDTRQLSHSLDSGSLKHFGLKVALKDLMEAIDQSDRITIEYHEHLDHPIGGDTGLNIYRIIQELVNNTLKYAQATKIGLEITQVDNKALSIIYEDNGIGYDPEADVGIGLKNIKSRIDFLGGTINFDTLHDRLKTVIIEIPLHSV